RSAHRDHREGRLLRAPPHLPFAGSSRPQGHGQGHDRDAGRRILRSAMVKSIDDAVAMVEAICHLEANRTALRRYEPGIRSSGLRQAIIAHDTAFLYGWLMEGLSLQGISDAHALNYIEAHGNADWEEIA